MVYFDPNDIANKNNNIFGLPFNENNAQIILIPVPWDVTTSYRAGSAKAPEAIFDASFQVDLFDAFKKNTWQTGIAMIDIPNVIKEKNETLKYYSREIISRLSEGITISQSEDLQKFLAIVNTGCSELNLWVKDQSEKLIKKTKLTGIIGGEHSVSFGFLQALSEKYNGFGILQIDAHADLRDAYEGFEFSHASIMNNALKIPQVKKLVQIGIRDYCEYEFEVIRKSRERIKTYFDRDIKNALFEGKTWKNICDDIIRELPENIYVSFDIDGLDPKLCPNTGTPVPGGFELSEVYYLLENIVTSGKKIIGFDLCEVAPGNDEWDANVGSRVLYRLANIMAKSNDT